MNFSAPECLQIITEICPVAEKIIMTGGLGDFFTIESFMSNEQRNKLTTIYYATRSYKPIQEAIVSLNNYPKLKDHIILWDDFTTIDAFHSKDQLYKHLYAFKKPVPVPWGCIIDWSIAVIFPLIRDGYLLFNGSSFLNQTLTSIEKFSLPKIYYVICPYTTTHAPNSTRQFDNNDWIKVLSYLEQEITVGVVINQGNNPIPVHCLLLDLTNKTNTLEAIEIIKKSIGYFGIDSAFSVLAAQLFNFPNLIVKSNNPHLYKWQEIYYAPKKVFDFIYFKMD